MKKEAVTFLDEEGNEKEFYVEEQTRVNGVNYYLVCDTPDGDGEALLLKDVSDESNEEGIYVPVTDPAETDALLKIFAEILEDIEIE